MKVIILAGGLGTRLSEETINKPKPLVEINKKTLLLNIIEHYNHYGYKDFIIASGYKAFLIKEYLKKLKKNVVDKDITIISVNTGLKTTTGGRIRKILESITDEQVLVTYGDGLSNVNISSCLKSHNKSKLAATVTAVHPPARFGAMVINPRNIVTKFSEKFVNKNSWINGGFFILERRKVLKFFPKKEDLSFENHTLPLLSSKNQLNAYKHNGFWHPCDTIRDKNELEKYKKSPWKEYD